MKLSQIAHISSGTNDRRNPQGSIYFLGAGDFIALHTLNPFIKPSVIPSSKLERHYLEKGDVLVLAKGHNGFPAHCYQGIKNPAVASSIFLVLKNIKIKVLPEYLAWYINLDATQNELENQARGTALPAINKKILGDLMIEVPEIETQHRIVALDQLKKQETKIIHELDDLKSMHLQILLKNKIH